MIREFTINELRALPYHDLFEKKLRECAIYHDEFIIRVDFLSCFSKIRRELINLPLDDSSKKRIDEYRKILTTVTINGIIVNQRNPQGLTVDNVQVIAQDIPPNNTVNKKIATPTEGPQPELRKKPRYNLQNLVNVVNALFFGEGVSKERREKRLDICNECDKLVFDEKNKIARCGICGCKLAGKENLVDLLRFEETPQYGCKHPNGSKWKAEGV